MADVVLVNKVDVADRAGRGRRGFGARPEPNRPILRRTARSTLDAPELVAGKRVLVVEDGPTLTHGGMKFGAGTMGARRTRPRSSTRGRTSTGTIAEIFERYDVGAVLAGEGTRPISSSSSTGDRADACDTVVIGTPMDLRHVIQIKKPTVRVTYRLERRVPTAA